MPVTRSSKASKPSLKVEVSTGVETKAAAAATPVVEETTVVPESTDAPVLMNRDSFLRNFRQLCTLSDEGKTYIESISNMLKSADADGTKRNINVIDFIDPIAGEGRAVIDVTSNSAVLLLFTESYSPSNVPITDRAPAIAKKVGDGCEGHGQPKPTIIQMIIVDKADYSRADRMAAHIYNLFSAMDNKDKYNVDLYKKLRLIPNTSLRAVKDFIERRSPHAVQDRVDWGVVMEIETGMERTTGYLANDTPLRTPVLAIGGYTKFIIHQDPMGLKVYPICVISNITSDIPVSGILNFAIPIAAGNAIINNKWMAPYTTFGKDSPNLGYFFNDPETKSLKFFTTLEELQQNIVASFMPPVLGIDIPEGRAHIPELEKLYNTYGTQIEFLVKDPVSGQMVKKVDTVSIADKFMLESADKFFGGRFADFKISSNGFLKPTAAVPWTNYEGTVRLDKGMSDTRECDYLNLIAMTKTASPETNTFLVQSMQPDLRIKNISKLLGEDAVKTTYRCTTILLNSGFVSALANVLSSQVTYVNTMNLEMNIPLNNYISQTMTPVTGTNSIFGGYSYSNPVANIYFK